MTRCLVLLLMLAVAGMARAQAPQHSPEELSAIKADLERVKADLEVLKSQMGQVLRMVSQRPQANAPVAPVRVNVAGAPVLGRADAPVTLVEFSDYQCPFCQRFFATTLPALKKEYVETGKLRYVFLDFPLDQLHPQARRVAEAAHCAAEQGKYWDMHAVLFQNQRGLATMKLAEHAQAAGVDATKLDQCVTSGRHASRVARSIADGAAVGVQATPTFVVGRTKSGDLVEGAPLRGAQPVETFRRLIEQALNSGSGS